MKSTAEIWFCFAWIAALSAGAAAQPHELSAQEAPPCRPAPPQVRGWELQTYDACQVTTPALWMADRSLPEYPDLMKRAGIEGRVQLLAVISRTGTVDTASVKTLKSTHEMFTAAAKIAMLAWAAKPGRIDTLPVRQLVYHTFIFIPTEHECISAPAYASQEVTVVCAAHERPHSFQR